MITKKYIKLAHALTELHGLVLCLPPPDPEGNEIPGYCVLPLSVIVIAPHLYKNTAEFMWAVCHELSHFICAAEGKYAAYHNTTDHNVSDLSTKEIQTVIRTAYKAEQYVDVKADELFKQWVPWLDITKTEKCKYPKNSKLTKMCIQQTCYPYYLELHARGVIT